MRKLLIGVAVLALVLVAADRISVAGIRVSPVRVDVPGLPGLPVSDYSSQLRIVVPLSTLPLRLHLTSVHVTPDGLRIAASARHVQFARG
jgi:hypothetical protein